jgi:hypothetical protein
MWVVLLVTLLGGTVLPCWWAYFWIHICGSSTSFSRRQR